VVLASQNSTSPTQLRTHFGCSRNRRRHPFFTSALAASEGWPSCFGDLHVGKSPWYPLNCRVGGLQKRSGCLGGNKTLLSLSGTELRFFNFPACSLLIIQTKLSWLTRKNKEINSNSTEQSPSSETDSRPGLFYYFLSGANKQNSKSHTLVSLLTLRAIRVTSKWSPLINIFMQFANNFARIFGTPTKLIRPSNMTHARPLLDTQGVCLLAQRMCCFTQRYF
jgi:hypothetical protein